MTRPPILNFRDSVNRLDQRRRQRRRWCDASVSASLNLSDRFSTRSSRDAESPCVLLSLFLSLVPLLLSSISSSFSMRFFDFRALYNRTIEETRRRNIQHRRERCVCVYNPSEILRTEIFSCHKVGDAKFALELGTIGARDRDNRRPRDLRPLSLSFSFLRSFRLMVC